jgi:leucyl/phenylalanyl-tRNA---protein transferase
MTFDVDPEEQERLAAEQALEEAIAAGLVAVGGDLSEATLLAAYQQGVFPWFSADEPILWYCPDPRFVLPLERFHVPRSTAKRLRRESWEIRCDTAFARVIERCAHAQRSYECETWIVPSMLAAYEGLARSGYAHSFEVWRGEALVGGLYGVSLGGTFFGESMFSDERDASKAALVALVAALRAWGFDLLDCQIQTEYLAQFGATEIPRDDFLAQLAQSLEKPTRRGPWTAAWQEVQSCGHVLHR